MVIVLNLILHFLTESLVLSNDHQRWWSQEYLRFNAFRGYAQVDRWADTHCAFPIPDECPWSQPFYLYQPIKKSHQDSLLWKQRLLAVHQETWTWKIQNPGIAGIIDKSHHFPSAQLASGGSWIWWKIERKAASHLTKQFVLWYNTKQLKSCNVGCEDVMNLRNWTRIHTNQAGTGTWRNHIQKKKKKQTERNRYFITASKEGHSWYWQ